MEKRNILLLLFLFLTGCSGLEQSEKEKLRRLNAKGEFVYRSHDEILYPLEKPTHRLREKYPWEEAYVGNHCKITKEFFRCKGNSLNRPITITNNEGKEKSLVDCNGSQRHSLPIVAEKEFIYPILIDLLNYVQAKTGKKVVITCGHRCPTHNTYADGSTFNQTSKHTIGAEVDFYVQGMEMAPDEVIKVLMRFYKEMPSYRGKKEYETFTRYEKLDTDVSTQPWMNKEIFIKLYKKSEGRDLDNRHSYPYIAIQVRHDRDSNERIIYSWPKASNGYRRY